MVETRMDRESSRGIGMWLLAPRLNNRNLIFFGSPAQWPRPRLLLENHPWEEHCSETLCFLPHSTDIDYKLLHTHTYLPSPDPRLRRFEPPAWQAGLWPAPKMAAGPDGCLLELDYFPCCKVVCLWFMCFLLLRCFSCSTLYSPRSIVWGYFSPHLPHDAVFFFNSLSSCPVYPLVIYVCCVCMDRLMANFTGTCD